VLEPWSLRPGNRLRLVLSALEIEIRMPFMTYRLP
jgi:hypothetical protein